jgi:hypothetical protein
MSVLIGHLQGVGSVGAVLASRSGSLLLRFILVTEPLTLYERYTTAGVDVKDEWTLSNAMGANLATEMENHYTTSIVSAASVSFCPSLSVMDALDRGRFRDHSSSRSQPYPKRFLGN